jgi:hypothetical protein
MPPRKELIMSNYTITLTDPSEIEIFKEIKNSMEIKYDKDMTDAEVIRKLGLLFYRQMGR